MSTTDTAPSLLSDGDFWNGVIKSVVGGYVDTHKPGVSAPPTQPSPQSTATKVNGIFSQYKTLIIVAVIGLLGLIAYKLVRR